MNYGEDRARVQARMRDMLALVSIDPSAPENSCG